MSNRDELIMSWLTREQKEVLENLDSCESPIEESLFVDILNRKDYFESWNKVRVTTETQKEVFYPTGRNTSITYRLDISIEVRCLSEGHEYNFAIECDGHEFHEKTKEQAASDRRRERNLMKLGYHVIRFTGSEIYGGSYHCAGDALEIIKKVITMSRERLRE